MAVNIELKAILTTLPRLGADPGSPFPQVASALTEPDGLLAWGGDLQPERLLNAYRHGIFPWFNDDELPLWWSPATRCVLPTHGLHRSRRLQRKLRQGRWRLTADRAFSQVIGTCAESREETWISPAMCTAYEHLHALGHAHSVEAWEGEVLAGGVYGVALGRMFFAESMFSARTDGSKAALAGLCGVLAAWEFPLIDCQFHTPHLERLGAVVVPRAEFVAEITELIAAPTSAGNWSEMWETTLAEAQI